MANFEMAKLPFEKMKWEQIFHFDIFQHSNVYLLALKRALRWSLPEGVQKKILQNASKCLFFAISIFAIIEEFTSGNVARKYFFDLELCLLKYVSACIIVFVLKLKLGRNKNDA